MIRKYSFEQDLTVLVGEQEVHAFLFKPEALLKS
jgi:hypothetical protein